MKRRAAFRQADITRAVKGAAKAGFSVGGLRIAPDGAIEVLKAAEPAIDDSAAAFSTWKAKRDARRA